MTQSELFDQFISVEKQIGHETQASRETGEPDWDYLRDEIENTKGIRINTITPRPDHFNLEFTFDRLDQRAVHHYPKTAAGYHLALSDIQAFQTV